MLFIIVLALLFPLTAQSSADTSYIVYGRVYDINTLDALPAANVIYGKNKGTITDLNGYYRITAGSGNLSIYYQFVGYKTVIKHVRLVPNQPIELNIGLEFEITQIDQIVISANKLEQKVSDLTVSMTVIKPEALYNSHITDAQELINKTSGIEVLDGQASIRGGSGFSYGAGSRVLALIDGLPVLSADAGNIKWQFLPLESLSQVEVIKGASSVLYGSSAINGIINFRTAEAGNTPATKFYAETGIFGKPKNENWVWWDSPRFFSSASFSHLQKIGDTDIGISTGLMNDNGYRKLNDQKLGRINLKLKHNNQKEGLTYGLNINGGYTSKRDFVLWEDATFGALKQAQSTAQKLHGSFLAIDPFISLNKKELFKHDLRTRFQYTRNYFPEGGQHSSNAISFFAEYQLWAQINDFVNVNIGLSKMYSRVDSEFYGNHEGFNLAGYSQLDISPTRKLKVVAGLRLEINNLNGENDGLIPLIRAGLNYKLFDYTFLRASFGQGYRYPSIAEKFAATTLGSVRIFPNPLINSEYGWNSEIGLKQGLSARSFSGQADFALFYSQYTDMIEYLFGLYQDYTSGLFDLGFKADNLEYSRVYGYELEFIINNDIDKFRNSIGGGYVFMYPVEFNKTTMQNTGIYLKYRRKHSGKINLSSQYKNLEFGLSMYLKSKILNIDDVFLDELTRESVLPGFFDYWTKNNSGYFLADVNIGYNLSKKYKLSLAVKNVTNTEYIGRPGDIMPHRNISLRFTGKL